MTGLDRLAVLWRIAVRNVRLHRMKSLVVGSIFTLGTALVMVGSAVVDAMDEGMTRSITQSLAGDLQIYSADAKDELAIYGDEFAGMPDFGVIPDFARVAEVVRGVPGVRAVVPMGSQYAFVHMGNDFDRRLAELRDAVRRGDAEAARLLKGHVRQMVDQLLDQLERARSLAADENDSVARLEKAKRAASDAFWAGFDAAPLAALETLENEVAPLQAAYAYLGVWFLGTDLDAFAENFDRFEVVKGTRVPKGRRGFLFNDGFYEDQVKHPVARGLDQLLRAHHEGRVIDEDAELRAKRDHLARQYQRIQFQLGPRAAAEVDAALDALVGAEGELPDKLRRFLEGVNAETVEARHAWFYEHVAPHIELYAVPVGGEITLRAFTRSGYARALDLPVYGTFVFSGLERSEISKSHNLVDLISFRELHGYMTPEREKEIAALRAEVGVEDVTRDEAEDALFGGDAPLVRTREATDTPAPVVVEVAPAPPPDRVYSRAEIEEGLALHAAIVLEEGVPLQAAKQAVQEALDAADLGIKVVTWQEASGVVGQLVLVVRLVLFFVIAVLGVVALVVINNSMVMATMERVHEIGTMRAIGAERGFVTRLFMAETLALGTVAGGVGALLGAGLVLWLGSAGIPADNPFMTFLFSGERLYPSLQGSHLLIALANVVVVGVLSTWYPARVAARIPPAEAMRET